MDENNNEELHNEDVQFIDLLESLHSGDINKRRAALKAIQENNIEDERLTLAIQTITLDDESSRLRKMAYDILREWDSLPPNLNFETIIEIEQDASDREIILRTLRMVESQQKMIVEMQNKVGCLYQFMIFSLILSVLSFLLGFAF